MTWKKIGLGFLLVLGMIAAGALGAILIYAVSDSRFEDDHAEATAVAQAAVLTPAAATVEAEDAYARRIIGQLCEAMEKRFSTDRALPSIYIQQLKFADAWLLTNADPNSEINLIAEAFLLDSERVADGRYVSWHDAFQQSGSKYMGRCAEASWRR